MDVPTYSPREIVGELDRFIVGQDDAKRAVAIALRNRWRRQQLPEGMREVIGQLVERYPDIPPIYITENGCAYPMGPDENGVVDDQPRIDYLDSHLRAIADAIADGADVRGYYSWSLMDNFEWAEGYTQRFGLVHIDYDTLVRTPKRSFDWYSEVIAANRG